MLKKIAIALMLILPMSVAAQTLKFGHIASREIIILMPEYTAAMGEMEKMQQGIEAELKRINDEFQKKYQEFQQGTADGTLPANIQERRQQELQEIASKGEQFQQDSYQQVQQKNQELMAPIMQKLDRVIKEVGSEEGLIYIFDISANSIPYINESQSIDVSPKVKTKLGI